VEIVKRISVAELSIDPERGKLWLNSPNCILRMQGISFKNIREKFSMIDINGANASMVEGDLATSDIHDFIEKVSNMAIINNYNDDDMKNILTMLELFNKNNLYK
jgi:hypothetical protein